MVFTPFYLPIVGLMSLFFLSYLSLMPTAYKLQVLTLVYFFTILLPTVLIHLYRKYQGWNLIELGHKERRMVPYVISILCYFFCVYIMDILHIPHFMGTIVSAALSIQIVCALINVWWKISTHTSAIGGVAGALFVFGEFFGFNPVFGYDCRIGFLSIKIDRIVKYKKNDSAEYKKATEYRACRSDVFVVKPAFHKFYSPFA